MLASEGILERLGGTLAGAWFWLMLRTWMFQFALQCICIAVLMWRVTRGRPPETPPDPPDRTGRPLLEPAVLLLGGVVIPVMMLILATIVFQPEWQGEKGDHWFFYIHHGWAGATILPVYLAASVSLGVAVFRRRYLAESRANFVMVATLAAIAAWYAFATLALGLTASFGRESGNHEIRWLAIVPAAACVNYVLFAVIIVRLRQLRASPRWFFPAWSGAVLVSILVKYPLARRIYEALPPTPPQDDCFVVCAATRGHRTFVRSWFEPGLGRTVNRQWAVLKVVEIQLERRLPRVHALLRRAYNRIGPPVARRIRSPFAADIAYLFLKPAEWAAIVFLALGWPVPRRDAAEL